MIGMVEEWNIGRLVNGNGDGWEGDDRVAGHAANNATQIG